MIWFVSDFIRALLPWETDMVIFLVHLLLQYTTRKMVTFVSYGERALVKETWYQIALQNNKSQITESHQSSMDQIDIPHWWFLPKKPNSNFNKYLVCNTFAPNNFLNDPQTSAKKQRKHVLRCITSVLISAAASTALPQRIADEILDWSVSCKRSSHTSLLLSLAQCSKTVMTPLKNIQQTRAIEWYLFMKLYGQINSWM